MNAIIDIARRAKDENVRSDSGNFAALVPTSLSFDPSKEFLLLATFLMNCSEVWSGTKF